MIMAGLLQPRQRAACRQHFQRNLNQIEVNLVAAEPLTNDQEERLRNTLREWMIPALDFTFRQVAKFTFHVQ
jgi:F0F1-type ATP synthase delta subunit